MAWLVIETETTIEVVPDYGKQHLLADEGVCWCPFHIEAHEPRDLVIHESSN
jgi:hypothetical protein